MDYFHVIEEGAVILHSKGIYKQAKIFRRGNQPKLGHVYAAWGGGFISLHGRRGTSHPMVSWLEIDGPGIELNKTGGAPMWTGV